MFGLVGDRFDLLLMVYCLVIIIQKIYFLISNKVSYPSSMPVPVKTKDIMLINSNSDVSMELSDFDSEILITAALVNLAMSLSSSVFANKLLILRWRKCSSLCLKLFHLSWSNGWRLWKALDWDLYHLKVTLVIDNSG